MTHTARRTGYASLPLVPVVLALGLLLGGCTMFRAKPGLLSDRGGLVPPPYEAPAPASSASMPLVPSPEPQFAAVLPGAGLVVEEPGEMIEEPVKKTAVTSDIELPAAPSTTPLTHTVGKGESLWVIASKYGVTYQELASANNMDANAVLKVGKVLTIPPGGRPGAASEGRAPTTSKGGGKKTTTDKKASAPLAGTGTYTVQSGDCLSKIAAKHGMTTAELRSMNNLSGDRIMVGQKLQVSGEAKGNAPAATKKPAPPKVDVPKVEQPKDELPKIDATAPGTTEQPPADIPAAPGAGDGAVAPAPGPTDAAKTTVVDVAPAPAASDLRKLPHDVCKDDTLENIAEMYGTTVQAILQANPEVKSNADLKVGNTIMVPYK